jgi:signal transduction histidine kinase
VNIDFLVNTLDGVSFGVFVLDENGIITVCNEQALVNLKIEKNISEVIDTLFSEHLGELPVLENLLGSNLSKGNKSFDLVNISFEEKQLNIRGRFTSNGLVVTTEDVTQVKKQEQVNLKAILQRQDSERNRLAREIHDGIGPVMSAMILHLDAIKSELNEIPQKTLRKINVIDELIHQAANDIRSISHALMPGALIDLGLVAALNNLCQKANESERIKINFYYSEMEDQLNVNLALGLYRIAQELLNNAFKHSQATIINVQLVRHPGSILLMVEDNGVGFRKAEIKQHVNNGIGLRNVQTRSKALGGQFNLDTQKGKGMIATVEIPLKG